MAFTTHGTLVHLLDVTKCIKVAVPGIGGALAKLLKAHDPEGSPFVFGGGAFSCNGPLSTMAGGRGNGFPSMGRGGGGGGGGGELGRDRASVMDAKSVAQSEND